MWYTMCGTYKKKLISTTSFYVVLIPYGIGDVVLISLTGGFNEMQKKKNHPPSSLSSMG